MSNTAEWQDMITEHVDRGQNEWRALTPTERVWLALRFADEECVDLGAVVTQDETRQILAALEPQASEREAIKHDAVIGATLRAALLDYVEGETADAFRLAVTRRDVDELRATSGAVA